MIPLSSDFCFQKYGFTVRLATEEDAGFIVKLRTRPEAGVFLHRTSSCVDDQMLWLKEYKKREQAGTEYYFIYEKNNTPLGINRVYDIHDDEGTTGSWICAPNTNPVDTLATAVLLYDIVFDVIELKVALFNTNKDNKSALRVNQAIGADYLYENDTDFFFGLKREKYHSLHDKLLRIWHLNRL